MTDKISEITEKLGLPTNKSDIERIVKKYPWFFTARAIIETDNGNYDPAMSLHLMLHPTPIAILKRSQANESCDNTEVTDTVEKVSEINLGITNEEAENIIETFLKRGAVKIIPKDDTPEFDAAMESGQLDISEDMATEELADIYMKQGHVRQAKTIYGKLKNK